jgi:hypothetical protein
MKPTPEQLTTLKNYLQQNLRFRETYIEFYDHILTALENENSDIPFSTSVQNILHDHFGGFDNIAKIEQSFKISATYDVKKKYAYNLGSFFKRSGVWVTMLLFALFFTVAMQPWFGFWSCMIAILVMRLLSSLLRGVRYIKSGYVFKSRLKSVRDGVFIWLDQIPVMVFILIAIACSFNNESPVMWFSHVCHVVPALFLTAMALHTVAYYKVYSDEFKMVLTAY